jgi:copper(I)-binding protein
MFARRRFLTSAVIGCFVALHAQPGWGDVPEYVGIDVVIEEPTATPGPVGGKSDLRFRVVNDGHHNLTFSGLETPVAEQSRLIATADALGTVLESVSIAAGETLDFTTRHLRYEIFPLRRSLARGEEFPVTLKFVEFEVSVIFHVH